MRTCLRVLTALALGVALAGCGDESAQESVPATTATTAPVGGEARLLTADDVGLGWQAGHVIIPEDLASIATLPCDDTAINPTIAERLTATTGAQFDPTDGSSRHLMELLVTGEPHRLGLDLRVLEGAVLACTEPVTVGELVLPLLGDQQWAVVVSAPVSPGSSTVWHARTGVARFGDTALVLRLTEILPDAYALPRMTDAEFAALVQQAAAKVGGTVTVTVTGITGHDGDELVGLLHPTGGWAVEGSAAGFALVVDDDPFEATVTLGALDEAWPETPTEGWPWPEGVALLARGSYVLDVWMGGRLCCYDRFLPGWSADLHACGVRAVTVRAGEETTVEIPGIPKHGGEQVDCPAATTSG